MKTSAKDFFLQLGTMVALYAGAIALLNLLFQVINVAFPQVNSGYYYGAGSAISFPVATLIVMFPLFLFLANILRKGYEVDPTKREGSVRKWLIYITLFVAGAVVAGDLITLIYYFLDGQELTAGFILKVLAVLVVTGGVFGYYLSDLRDKLTRTSRLVWSIFAGVLVLGSIVIGFAVIGSPSTQRALRYDNQRVNDLQNIQWQIINYWQQKGSLPVTIAELNDPISGWVLPVDPDTGEKYEYQKVDPLGFQLCARFDRESQNQLTGESFPARPVASFGEGKSQDSWAHAAGRTCFPRTIDPDLYPVREKGLN